MPTTTVSPAVMLNELSSTMVVSTLSPAGRENTNLNCARVSAAPGVPGFAAGLRNRHEILLMASFRSPALYDALSELAHDDMLRRRVAAGGHARVQSLRWADAAATLESAYRQWTEELARQ